MFNECFQYVRHGFKHFLCIHLFNASNNPLQQMLLILSFLILLWEKLRNRRVKNMITELPCDKNRTASPHLLSHQKSTSFANPNPKDSKSYIFKCFSAIRFTFHQTARSEEGEALCTLYEKAESSWVPVGLHRNCFVLNWYIYLFIFISMWKREVAMLMKFTNDFDLRCC